MDYLLNPDGTSSFTTISDLKDNFEESFAKKQLGARMTDIFNKSICNIEGVSSKDIFEDPFAKSLIDNSIAEVADKCFTNQELGGNSYIGGIRKIITEYVGMESDYREDLAYAILKKDKKLEASGKIFELFSTENLDFMAKNLKKQYFNELEMYYGSESDDLVTEIGKEVGEAISEANEKNIIINQTSAVIQETQDEMNKALTGGDDEGENESDEKEENGEDNFDDSEDTGEDTSSDVGNDNTDENGEDTNSDENQDDVDGDKNEDGSESYEYGSEALIGLNDKERNEAIKFFKSKQSLIINEYVKYWNAIDKKVDSIPESKKLVEKTYKSEKEFKNIITEKMNFVMTQLSHKKGIFGNSKSKFKLKLFSIKGAKVSKMMFSLFMTVINPIIGIVIITSDKDEKSAGKIIKNVFDEDRSLMQTKLKVISSSNTEIQIYDVYIESEYNLKRFYNSGGTESFDEAEIVSLEERLQDRLEADINDGNVTIGVPQSDITLEDSEPTQVSDHEETEIVNHEEPDIGDIPITVSNVVDNDDVIDNEGLESYEYKYGIERFIGLSDDERKEALAFFKSKKKDIINEYVKLYKQIHDKKENKDMKIKYPYESINEFEKQISTHIDRLYEKLERKKGVFGNSTGSFTIKLISVEGATNEKVLLSWLLAIFLSIFGFAIIGLIVYLLDSDRQNAKEVIKDLRDDAKSFMHTDIKIKKHGGKKRRVYDVYLKGKFNLKKFYNSNGVESLELEYRNALYGNENISKTVVPLSPTRLDSITIPSTKTLSTLYIKGVEGLDSLQSVITAKFDILKDIVDREHDEELIEKYDKYKARAMEAFEDARLIAHNMNNINITPFGIIGSDDPITTAIGSRAHKYLNHSLKLKHDNPKRSYEDSLDAINAAFDIAIIKDKMRHCKNNDILINLSHDLAGREDLFWNNIVDLHTDEEKKEQIKNILQFADLDLSPKALVDNEYLKSIEISLDTMKPKVKDKSESEINEEIFEKTKTKIESFLGKDMSMGQIEITRAIIEGRDTSDIAPTPFEKFILKLGTDEVLEKDGDKDFEIGQESAETVYRKAIVLTTLEKLVGKTNPMSSNDTEAFNKYLYE